MADAPRAPLQDPATWDSVATGYAEEFQDLTEYADECLRLAELDAAHDVLDVGTGPGTLALRAAPKVRHVTAVDFAPKMIDELNARLARDGVHNVTARVMDAQSLAFPDGSFDVVFALFTFMFFPDRPRAFAEVRRVLRPGGQLIMATWAPIERRPAMKLAVDAFAEALPDLPRPTKGDLQHREECESEMQAAGFRNVSARAFDAGLKVSSRDRYLEQILRAGASFAAIRANLGEERWASAVERMRTALSGRIPEGGTTLGAEALLTIGTSR